MKKLIVFVIIIASLSCNTNRQVARNGSQIGLRNLPHYFLKSSIALNSGYNGIVIPARKSFEDMFYSDAADASVPDFSGQIVVALAINSEGNESVSLTKAELAGDQINVFGSGNRSRPETESSIAVATLPRCADAKSINFFVDGKLVKTLPLSSVSAGRMVSKADRRRHNNPVALQKQTLKKPVII